MESGPESVAIERCSLRFTHAMHLFAFDPSGRINVFRVDDIKPGLHALGFQQQFCQLVEDILNANVVLAISKKLGLIPGLTFLGDQMLSEAIAQNLSPSLSEYSAEVIAQLLSAWNKVALNPGARKHHLLTNESQVTLEERVHFSRFVYYELFINDIFDIIIKVWKKHPPEPHFKFYLQFVDFFVRTPEGDAIKCNEFLNLPLLLAVLKKEILGTTMGGAVGEQIVQATFSEKLKQKREHLALCQKEAMESLQSLSTQSAVDSIDEVQRQADQIGIRLSRLKESASHFSKSVIEKKENTQYSDSVFSEKKKYHALGSHWDYISRYNDMIHDLIATHVIGWAEYEMSMLPDLFGCLELTEPCGKCRQHLESESSRGAVTARTGASSALPPSFGTESSFLSASSSAASMAASSTASSALSVAQSHREPSEIDLSETLCTRIESARNHLILSILQFRPPYPVEDLVAANLRMLLDIYQDPKGSGGKFLQLAKKDNAHFKLSEIELIQLIKQAVEGVLLNNITVYPLLRPQGFTCIPEAESDQLEEVLAFLSMEEHILSEKIRHSPFLKPEILYAIYAATDNSLLKDTLVRLVDKIVSSISRTATLARLTGYPIGLSSVIRNEDADEALPRTELSGRGSPGGDSLIRITGLMPSLIFSRRGLGCATYVSHFSQLLLRRPYDNIKSAMLGEWPQATLEDSAEEQQVISALQSMHLEDDDASASSAAAQPAKSSWWPF